jgi:hypothetical protein
MTSIKLSILFLYRRTFTRRETWFLWCWWILLALVLLWTATCTIMLAVWMAGKISNHEFPRLAISTVAMINTVSDILYLILLGLMIARMKLQKNQKLALVTVFGVGAWSVTLTSQRWFSH